MTTFKIVLRKKQLKDGSYPVVLRVTKNRENILIPLGIRANKKDFANQEFLKSYPNYRKRNVFLAKAKINAEKRLDDFLEKEKDFTLKEFAEVFSGKSKSDVDVWQFFNQKVEILIRSGKIGSAKAYEETKAAMIKYHSGTLKFKDVNVEFLEKFELSMRERGNEDGGIAFKMRQLRALYNEAIKKDIVDLTFYPFRKYKVSKLKGRGQKRALSATELKSFLNLDLKDSPHLIDTHNFFLFSFYCRGMNFTDMAHLKWTDVQNEKIRYTRKKTKKQFVIEVLPPVKKILDTYKERKITSLYVFPILLKAEMTPQQIDNRKHKVLRRVNSRLRELAGMAGINKRLTFYVARHSYATILKFQGVSTDVISEALGHSNLSITMTYLKEFDNALIDKEHKKLLDL